jgi:exo-beta-1,3-glucanase (GH17 family)
MRNPTFPILVSLALFLCSSLSFADKSVPVPLVGVTYNGLRLKDQPSSQEVDQELTTISQKFNYARTYYPQYDGGKVRVVDLANTKQLKLLVGLYMFDPPNQGWTINDFNNFIKPHNADQALIGVLVGNENLDGTETKENPGKLEEIKKLIDLVKTEAPNLPVSTSQTNGYWLKADPKLVEMVDFIAANIYPSWCWTENSAGGAPAASCGSPTPVDADAAFKSFVEQFDQLKKLNKQIVVTETGYPTNYGDGVGLGSKIARTNACQYMQLVSNWAKENNQAVFIYEMFNSKNAIDKSKLFNFNFGIQDKFPPLPSFKNNFPEMNCSAVQ